MGFGFDWSNLLCGFAQALPGFPLLGVSLAGAHIDRPKSLKKQLNRDTQRSFNDLL
jgi:hypothetical protein